MKYFRSKRKKWHELTTDEKVNLLKAGESDYGEGVALLAIIMLPFLFIIILSISSISNYHMIMDIYNQTGISLSDTTNQTTTELRETLGNSLIIIIIILLFCIVYMYGRSIYHYYKWKPFYKSLHKKEQVKY